MLEATGRWVKLDSAAGRSELETAVESWWVFVVPVDEG